MCVFACAYIRKYRLFTGCMFGYVLACVHVIVLVGMSKHSNCTVGVLRLCLCMCACILLCLLMLVVVDGHGIGFYSIVCIYLSIVCFKHVLRILFQL